MDCASAAADSSASVSLKFRGPPAVSLLCRLLARTEIHDAVVFSKGCRTDTGTFGIVRAATYTHEGVESNVAVKTYQRPRDAVQEAAVELHACVALRNHPNIVQIIDAGLLHGRPGLVFEQASEDLAKFILRQKGRQCPIATRHIITDLAAALAHVHSQRVVHTDVKPENVLVFIEPSRDIIPGSFGCIAKLSDLADVCAAGAHRSSDPTRITTECYRAPELTYKETKWSSKVDDFSFGVTMYELASGRLQIVHHAVGETHSARLRRFLGAPSPSDLAKLQQYPCFSAHTDNVCTSGQYNVDELDGHLGGPGCVLLRGLLAELPHARLSAADVAGHAYLQPTRFDPASKNGKTVFEGARHEFAIRVGDRFFFDKT